MQTNNTLSNNERIPFTLHNEFHVFLFSYNKDKKPLFLLSKSSRSPDSFINFPGHYTKDDPVLHFGIAREFVTQTRGLLNSENFKYFLAENAEKYSDEHLVLEKVLTGPVRPQKGFTAAINDICGRLCECNIIYQDSEGNVSYFVEVPLMNVELINKIAKEKGIELTVGYFTLEDILNKKNNSNISTELRDLLKDENMVKYIQDYVVDRKPIEFKEYYAVLSCDANAKTYMLHSLHYSVFKKHGEHWRFYKAFENDFPTDAELKQLKGIIIPGSGNSAYQTDVPWFTPLFECIRKIVYEYPHINFLNICFGAQITAQALGGRVEQMNRTFLRGADELFTKEDFYELDYVKDLGLDTSKNFVIGKAHRDHIVQLPPGAKLYGSSNTTEVEMYTIGDNVFAVQGHPEFNEAWTAGANFRNRKVEAEDYEKYAAEYIKETFKKDISQKELLNVCYAFLKKGSKKLKE